MTLRWNKHMRWEENIFSFFFKCSVPRETLHSLAKHLCSLAQVFCSPKKQCIPLANHLWYLNIFHNSPTKVLHSLRDTAFIKEMLCSLAKHLCSLAKLLCSPEKCCIISQKFALPQNFSQFSHTSIAFLRETFHSLTKHLHSLAQGLKIIWTKCPSHHILFPSQLLFLKVFIYVFTITMSFLGAPNKTN